jgi:hypothetical protein
MSPDALAPSSRETFRHAPAALQPLITFVSGKPLAGSRPGVALKPWMAVGIDYAKYGVGIAGAAAAVSAGGAWLVLLPLFWILTVNGARSLTSDAHYAGHAAITGRKRFDKVLGDLLSLSVLSPNMDDYAQGHNRDHHGKMGIGTLEDPDIGLMRLIGFETGRSRRFSWLRLLLALGSPRYHLLYSLLRLRSTLVTAPVWRMAAAWLIFGGLAYATHRLDAWETVALAWLVPIGPLYAISAALQFPSEHMWLAPQRPGEDRRAYLLRVSHGRFFLVPAPGSGRPWAWCAWGLRMVPQVLARLFVCVSILPAHDYHHRFANRKDWPMEPFLRQADQDAGAVYRDFYGLKEPTDALFDAWSRLPPEAAPPARTLLSLAERVAALLTGGVRRAGGEAS